MPATDHRTATLRCSDAFLCRQGDKLTISWHDSGVLSVPVSWCRDIRADRTDEGVSRSSCASSRRGGTRAAP